MKFYDVMIVGCGPTGATLASLLRAKGHSVAIFDRDKDVFHAPRAMVIDAESCRIYQAMGTLERLMKEDADPYRHHRFVDKNRKLLLSTDFGLQPSPFGQPGGGMMFHQPGLERFLREEFSEGVGVDAFLGHEVLEVQGDGPAATLKARDLDTGDMSTYSGRFIVGSDGGASMCRRAIGARRIDFGYERKWIVMDVIVHDRELWESMADGSEFMCRPNAAVVFVKGHHGHCRIDFEVDEERAKSFTEEDAFEAASVYLDTSSLEFIRIAPYSFYAGMPDRWRKGRILLAGDAAHQTSPFSGQGLNMGIRDALNLAFKFDMIFKGHADQTLLDSYQEERWENCRALILGASERGKMISDASLFGRLKRNALFTAAMHIPAMLEIAARRRIPFPSYSGGLISSGHDLCGSRLIQPVVEVNGQRMLMDDVTGDGFLLFLMKPEQGQAISWFRHEFGGRVIVVGEDFVDADRKLTDFMEQNRVSAILVRPDRYIFAAGEDGNAVCNQFRDHLARYQTELHETISA